MPREVGSDRSPWLRKTYLGRGSGWDPYVLAGIVFEIITVLALVGILVWSGFARKRLSQSRSVTLCFTLAIWFAIISFAWIALTAILAESSAVVLELYSIFDIIIRSFRTVADILLLVTVLLSIGAYMTNAGAGGPSSSFKPMAKKLALCGPILGIFWLVVLALQLALLVQIVEGKENNLLDVFNALLKIHFVYDLLYLIVVFGICCWTLVLSRSARGSTGPRAKAPIILFVIIGLSLFTRQIWFTVTDGLFLLSTDNSSSNRPSGALNFARQMFYYICTVIAYAALVAVGSRREAHGENTVSENGNEAGVPRVAAPEPSWKRESYSNHSQDPIHNGPQVTRDV
ncbi:MAG: hypothetical protein LQ348_005339 [Seirophora lacunosa]|nr:MAG: hypothetical protein LQ344_008066 [Seirophora lacunosa]KAI4179729.1 MAG: hypothetical protein LQ348_005339 [Seirophora lacunosa]